MPNGFENPYIETVAGEDPLEASAMIQYLSGLGVDPYFDPDHPLNPHQVYWSPQYSEGLQFFDVNLPEYQYSGMNPEIMSALVNVFNPGEGTFSPQEFGMDIIQQQIEDQVGADYMMDMSDLTGNEQWTAQDAWDYFTDVKAGEIEIGEQDLSDYSGHDFDDYIYNIGGIPELEGLSGSEYWNYLFDLFATPTIEGDIGELVFGDTFESALPFTNVFDPESIANTLSQLGDFGTGGGPTAAEIRALTPEMIAKTHQGYYEPYETVEREELIEKMAKAQSKVPTGGFAGSGQRVAGLSGAEKLYRGGYEDVLANILKMRGKETEDVLETIFGWQELI